MPADYIYLDRRLRCAYASPGASARIGHSPVGDAYAGLPDGEVTVVTSADGFLEGYLVRLAPLGSMRLALGLKVIGAGA